MIPPVDVLAIAVWRCAAADDASQLYARYRLLHDLVTDAQMQRATNERIAAHEDYQRVANLIAVLDQDRAERARIGVEGG